MPESQTTFSTVERGGHRFIEALPAVRLLNTADDATLVIEACFSNGTHSVLLYAGNFTEQFFDLSSRLAGAVLQKLRNYRIRLALVCPPGTVAFSSRFGEMASEERETGYFRIFEAADPARDWLASSR